MFNVFIAMFFDAKERGVAIFKVLSKRQFFALFLIIGVGVQLRYPCFQYELNNLKNKEKIADSIKINQ